VVEPLRASPTRAPSRETGRRTRWRRARAVVAGTCALAIAGCGSEREPDRAPLPPNPLLNPDALTERAPDVFRVRFETSKGTFVVEVHRAWAPQGADRFYNLVKNGYYDGVRFFRVLEGFVAQFGIHGDPRVNAAWRGKAIPDDPVVESNVRGTLSFAMAGPHTRTTQVFINLGDNARLDGMGFAPFGRVVEGMEVVDALYAGYGEGAPRGAGPNQARIQAEGNAYLDREFPQLDYVTIATLVHP
jgi:peptidyl-prolyl cis-trans isomerase A (cyclophilin A)